ncbi:MAG: hypothetical protein Q8O19_04625, partial [Rectinemataceae bacterium]|nr:hypothetical protein [Rectinemataceae bacterium]
MKKLNHRTFIIPAVIVFAVILMIPHSVVAGITEIGPGSGSGTSGSLEDETCKFTPSSGINFGKPSFACDGELLANYMVELNKFFYRLAIVLAVLMITIGGFQWLSAMGNSSKISSAKETIEQAVIGLALAFTAYLIFSQIDTSFVQLKSLVINNDTLEITDCSKWIDRPTCITSPKISCAWSCAGEGFASEVVNGTSIKSTTHCKNPRFRPRCTLATGSVAG